MVAIHPQYVIDENQERKAVLLSVADWEQILDELDELEDMRCYDEAKSASHEAIPFDLAVREIRENYG
ncbi:MAG: hypothetical protein HZA20_04795 [Nitrospirae bacterium]|nr:hypothetical protein [Nitrospirota bacterium]